MRASIDNLRRLASVLATLIIGVVFAMVTSVNAAPPDKKIEVKDKEKIEKVEEIEEVEETGEAEVPELEEANSRGFNRFFLFDNKRLNNNNLFFKKDRN